MLRRIFLLVVLTLSLMTVSGVSYGQLPVQQNPNPNQLDRTAPARQIPENPQANSRISQRQAVNLARQRFPGNILRISLIGEGQNQRYQIRMENEGKVFTVFVHATTGRVTGGT